MAVSKELLARYKEMKAKGINITLTELKKQMEEEENMTSSPIEQASNESAQAFESNPTQSENTWTTTYSNNNYSESMLMVKALENMSSDEIKAIYTSLLSNNEIGNVSNNLVSLIKKTDIYDHLKSNSSNIGSITSTFNSGISDNTSKIDLWNTIKHNKDVQNYLESKMGTVYDVNNLAHKGIYAKETEYRNTYQSNDSPSGNTFTVNSNGTSTTGKGKYRATDKNAAIQTRYIYIIPCFFINLKL